MHNYISKGAVFSLVVSAAGARRLDLGKRSQAVITRLATDSVAGASWFEYEKHQLTQDALEGLRVRSPEPKVADLIAFDTAPNLEPGECRTFPGDSSWPPESEWSELNNLLGGSLIQTVPIAAPCYKDWDVYNKEQCDAISEKFTNPYLQ